MNFSKTTEYALRVISYMAMEDGELFHADFLHKKLDIPQRYLRRLMTSLAKSGLIISIRGRNGGFAFARDISGIHIADIIIAVEGEIIMNPCIMGFSKCALSNPCPMHDLWVETKDNVMDVLNSITLADIKKTKTRKK